MRTTPTVAGIAVAAALTCAVGWTATQTARAGTRPSPAASAPVASAAACYAFAVGALRQRVVVRQLPRACAGLGPEQVNEVIARAVRTVVGPLPKAAARQRAVAYSRFLGSLVRPARPPRAQPAAAAAAQASSSRPARLAALAAWLAAAGAGAYLLVRGLTRDGRHRVRVAGASWWVAGSHAGLAAAGLILWIVFVLTAAAVIGWIDVTLTWLIAGLGMATLLAGAPEPQVVATSAGVLAPAASQPAPGVSPPGPGTSPPAPGVSPPGPATSAPRPGRPPVVTIALHGALATAAIVLVLLAVIGVG